MEKKKRVQIAFDVPPELRQEIKLLALRRNISMNMWILRAVHTQIKKERREPEYETEQQGR